MLRLGYRHGSACRYDKVGGLGLCLDWVIGMGLHVDMTAHYSSYCGALLVVDHCTLLVSCMYYGQMRAHCHCGRYAMPSL